MNFDNLMTLSSNQGVVYIDPNHTPLSCYLKKDADKNLIKIQEVILPIALEKIPFSKQEDFFKQTYAKVVQLNDNTYKLYVNLRLLGGVRNIVELIKQGGDETTITNEIIAFNIPANTFSSVQVSSCQYNFFGLGNKEARVISLRPGSNGFYSFLISVQRFFIGYSPSDHTYNTTALSKLILGIENSQQGRTELETAFNDKRGIYVYVSTDGKFFYCELEQGQSMCNVM